MLQVQEYRNLLTAQDRDGFIFPSYGLQSLTEVPASVAYLLSKGIQQRPLPTPWLDRFRNQKVLLLIVDGLGWDFVVRYQDQVPLFGRLAAAGEVFPITSVFPSTTPAALTSIHTGRTPQEHGLPEWFTYLEEFDVIAETLPFRAVGTSERDALLQSGGSPGTLYEGDTLYTLLAREQVRSWIFTYHEYAHTVYSSAVLKGAQVVPFSSGPDMAEKLHAKLSAEPGPGLFVVYWTPIDAVGHTFGPGTPEHLKEIIAFGELVQKDLFARFTSDQLLDVTVALTADHGQTNIRGEDVLFLNPYLELAESYLFGKNGESIFPTGSPHDVFLFIYEPKLDQTITFLQKALEGKAVVLKTSEAVQKGLFGLREASEKFLRRVGNVLILPKVGSHVWYDYSGVQRYYLKGIHGGLSKEEMIVPFALGNAAALHPTADADSFKGV